MNLARANSPVGTRESWCVLLLGELFLEMWHFYEGLEYLLYSLRVLAVLSFPFPADKFGAS
jgi:hypothetical protein